MSSTVEFHGQDLVLTFHQPAGTGAAAFLVEYQCASATITHKIDQSAYQSEDAQQARHYKDTLTYAENNSAGLTRDPTVTLYAVDALGNQSPPTIVALQNSIPVLPQAPAITPTLTGVTVSCQTPLDADNVGFIAWVDTTSSVTMDDAHVRYRGSSSSFDVPLADDETYYLRVAPYDAFGLDTNSAWEAISIARSQIANNGTIASLLTNVDDLIQTYGTTTAAAASASNAAASESAAETYANTAQTASSNINQAVSAAQAAATQAGQSASSIGNSLVQATAAAVKTFPNTIDNSLPAFTLSTRDTVANAVANPLPAAGFVTEATYGTNYQTPAPTGSGAYIEIGTVDMLPFITGKLYKVTGRYGVVSAPNTWDNDDNGPAMAVFDANYKFLTLAYPTSNIVNPSDGLDTFTATFGCGATGGDFVIRTANAAWLRPVIHVGAGSRTASPSPTMRFVTLDVSDVTAQVTAQTYASQASTSATNAQGFANTAQTQAGVATSQATGAGKSATSASGSAQTATNQATAAGQSASAANASATQANTSAGNAATSAGSAATSASQASTSASNAQGSANSAATSASTSATAQNATQAMLDKLYPPLLPTNAASFVGIPATSHFDGPSTGWPTSYLLTSNDGSITSMEHKLNHTLEVGRRYRLSFWVYTYSEFTRVDAYVGQSPNANGADGGFEKGNQGQPVANWNFGNLSNIPTQVFYPIALDYEPQAGDDGFWNFILYVNPQETGTPSNLTYHISGFNVSDVTDSYAALVSANAAATSASNAAASETAAGQSASAAQQQATSAQTQAGNAQTWASQASTSATNAQGFMSNAQGAANTATSQAGVSSSSSLTAQQAMALTFPSVMSPGAPFVDNTNGAPASAIAGIYPANEYVAESIGTVWNSSPYTGFFNFCSVGVITPVVGRTYDLEVKARLVTANTVSGVTNCVANLQFVGLNSTYQEASIFYGSDVVAGYPNVINNGSTYDWTVFKCRATIPINFGGSYLRPRFYGNYNQGSGAQPNAVYEIAYFKVTDVTEMVAAANSAAAAAGSAGNAASSANAANTSAQTASTQATNAGNSANAASGSAGQASTYAGNANTYQQQASGYANNSSASANSASGSATSAQQQAVNAQTQASNAQTYASQASGSAASASNSAAAASSNATLSASVGTSSLIANPFFTAWPTDGQPPSYWSWWDASFGTSRQPGIQGRPYSAYFNVTNTSNNGGFVQNQNAAFGAFVIEITGRATNWQAAGCLVYFLDTNSNIVESCTLHCGGYPDTSNYTSADGGNGAYTRSFSKFYRTNINGNIQRVQIYAMASWNGFGAAQTQKQIWFDKVSIRPATQPEIDAGTALANANSALSQISSESSTRASQVSALTTQANTLNAFVQASPNLVSDVVNWTINDPAIGKNYGGTWGSLLLGYPTGLGPGYQQRAISERVSCDAGAQYTLSCDLLCIPNGGPQDQLCYAQVRQYDGGGNLIGDLIHTGSATNTNFNDNNPNRTNYWGTGVAASNATSLDVEFWAKTDSGQNYPLIGIRQVKLERGAVPTGYTVEGQASTVSASVTQQAGAISTLNGKNVAYFQTIAAAGGATAAVAVQADGVAGNSTIDLVATSIALSTTANGSSGYQRVLTVDGGGVHVYGNLATSGSVSTANLQDNSVTSWILASNPGPFQGGSSSGSGGGGTVTYCVADTSFMPSGKLAGDMAVGDDLHVLNRDDDMGYHIEQVVDLRRSVQPCSRIETMSGATLVVSNSTPITLRGGKVVPLMMAHGREVPVKDDNGFRWERIIAIEPVGELPVTLIFVDHGTYAAGEKPGRYIFTHNKVAQ